MKKLRVTVDSFISPSNSAVTIPGHEISVYVNKHFSWTTTNK